MNKPIGAVQPSRLPSVLPYGTRTWVTQMVSRWHERTNERTYARTRLTYTTKTHVDHLLFRIRERLWITRFAAVVMNRG